ncbi:MAG: PadR family transcriptional regulator [Thermomonas sp.]
MAKTTEAPALSPVMHHILLALLEGERHGYAIMQSVERITDGAVSMGPGTLYGALKRLLDAGLVEEAGERSEGDERRRYYRLTALGRRAVHEETARLQRLVEFARDFLPSGKQVRA